MSFKKTISPLVPGFLKTKINAYRKKVRIENDAKYFNSLETIGYNIDNLLPKNDFSFEQVFTSNEINANWEVSKKEVGIFTVPDGTGGVNYGDRRALYYLIYYFKPATVLEVGTHIGASTVNVASALYHSRIKNKKSASLITIDIKDVNSETEKPWLHYGNDLSPRQMIDKLGYKDFVEFKVGPSLDFLKQNNQKFDFIFLDGDHSATTVYQEIPAALKMLNKGGVILLHDYFPDLEPLWSNGNVIRGPFMASQRLVQEGVGFEVLPLGKLPWPTKLDSNMTSLALVMA